MLAQTAMKELVTNKPKRQPDDPNPQSSDVANAPIMSNVVPKRLSAQAFELLVAGTPVKNARDFYGLRLGKYMGSRF